VSSRLVPLFIARGAAALLPALAVVAFAAPSASAASFGCDASAVRATIATGPPIEPVTANHGPADCRDASASLAALPTGLPVPATASLISAATTLTGEGLATNAQTAQATASIADVNVPALPIALPPGVVPTIPGLPDLTPIIQSLIQAPLLHLSVASAQVNGSCANGGAVLTGSSNVAGLTVLGHDLPINQTVSQLINVFGTGTISGSQIYAALPPALQNPGIATILNALPPITIPPQLATVTITPNEQTNSGGVMTQRALHVNITLGGQQLLDAVFGEAQVSAAGQPCLTPTTAANQAALACTKRRLVLIDVIPDGRRVRLLGAADKKYIGKRVSIVFTGNGKVVARPKVAKNGSFRATAPMPAASIRDTNRARYFARIGHERSLRLKLMRRMIVSHLSSRKGRVTIAGRVIEPLANPVRSITVRRRLSCKRWQVVKHITPSRNGSFRVVLKAPKGKLASVYRLTTRVRKVTTNPKTYPTFTLPRAVAIFG